MNDSHFTSFEAITLETTKSEYPERLECVNRFSLKNIY